MFNNMSALLAILIESDALKNTAIWIPNLTSALTHLISAGQKP